MRNQVAAAERMGVRAETLNSQNSDEWPRVIERIENGEIDIWCSPLRRLLARKEQNWLNFGHLPKGGGPQEPLGTPMNTQV